MAAQVQFPAGGDTAWRVPAPADPGAFVIIVRSREPTAGGLCIAGRAAFWRLRVAQAMEAKRSTSRPTGEQKREESIAAYQQAPQTRAEKKDESP